jgi:hypothetical protein
MQFEEMIGETVIAIVPFIDRVKFQELKIHGAEAGGIWVESQTLTNLVLKSIKQASAPRTPIFFVPFSQITMAWQAIEQTSLSEPSFDV